MPTINLLDFFRTGKVGSIEIGMTKEDVKDNLGMPDDWWRNNPDASSHPYTQEESIIWIYGGIEFYWTGKNATLKEISFKPHYLHWHEWKTQLDYWIFRSRKGPTVKRLKSALKREKIPFQDTGFEIFISQYDSAGTYSYTVIPLQNAPAIYDSDNVFGTLVLKSGMQVRYGEDNYIIKAATSDSWAVQGSERFIQW